MSKLPILAGSAICVCKNVYVFVCTCVFAYLIISAITVSGMDFAVFVNKLARNAV